MDTEIINVVVAVAVIYFVIKYITRGKQAAGIWTLDLPSLPFSRR